MWKTIVGYTVLTLAAVSAPGFAYLYYREPVSRPPSDVKVAMTAERVARGRYIYTLADCDGCHSPHDNSRLYFPVVAERRGAGQHIPHEDAPGTIVAPNITTDVTTGLGAWTDGEKIRAIREGIGRDGRALFPMMPYESYRHMSDQDVESLVAYLNTLAPVENDPGRTEIRFPASMLMKGAPRPVEQPVKAPPRSNTIAWGEYLVTIGVCEGCHTPMEKGSPVVSKRLAGGTRFSMDGFSVVSANISSDRDTGIGNWTVDQFLDRFRRHRNMPADHLPGATNEQWTLMPWRNLAQLTDQDLAAMFAYLRSRPPVSQKVITHPVEVAAR